MKPMSLRAFARLWDCEAEWERCGEHRIHLFEPLDVDLPAEARPLWNGDRVTFFSGADGKRRAVTVQVHEMNGASPDLVCLSGRWWEMGSGQVVHRDGRWQIQRVAWDNTRAARMMNAGFTAWSKPEPQPDREPGRCPCFHPQGAGRRCSLPRGHTLPHAF